MRLHNALYGLDGKLTELFPNENERVAFGKTSESRDILRLLAAAFGEPARSPNRLAENLGTANGALSVRVPRAIHAALLAEAKAEGVSLNQLCLAKLAVQLRAVV